MNVEELYWEDIDPEAKGIGKEMQSKACEKNKSGMKANAHY